MNGYGLYFRRWQDAMYFFEISPDGVFRLTREESARRTTLVNWTRHSAIKTGKQTNALRVVGKGTSFTLYVNDAKLGTFSDSTFSAGLIGPALSIRQGNMQVAFDNLRIWELGTPSAGATEEFTKGQLLFEDDFATNNAKWREETSQYKEFFQDSRYHVSILTAGLRMNSGEPQQKLPLKDFALEVEAALLEGSSASSYGVLFRKTPSDAYHFSLTGDGKLGFSKYIGGRWTNLIRDTRHSTIQTGNSPNLIRIVARGTAFIFFVNGVRVGASYGDNSLDEGTIALAVSPGAEELARAAFRNLKIWELLK